MRPFTRSSLSFAAAIGLLLPVPASLAAAPARTITPSACPVELTATQGTSGQLIATGQQDARPPAASGPQQVIDLSLKNDRLQRIVAAELEVHGTSSNSRMLPARGAVLTDRAIADTVRNVHLTSSVPADQRRTRSLAVNDLTSVAWVEVIELRYADGSTWHAGPGRACVVTPDPAMLVANR